MKAELTNVLLVDDDPALRRFIGRIMQADGYNVCQVENGSAALRAIERQCPDYIITDWEMPRMNGLELCRKIREATLRHYVYVVMLTARGDSEAMISAMEAGADDFLTKPIERESLIARLRAGERVLKLERRLVQLANHDPLTGIPTRRMFFNHFEKELSRSKRYHLPLSCVMLDVDFFKTINDTHGHAVGDLVLRVLADLLTRSCRESDFVCRYGGEEFCILLPETVEADALRWADKLRMAIAASAVPFDDQSLRFAASMGVAQLMHDVSGPDELVSRADQALLVAKQSGRNRVVPFSSLDGSDTLKLSSASDENELFGNVTARDVMTRPVVCVRHNETIKQAADFFYRYLVNSVPVVDDEGQLAGILSEKDVLAVMLQPDCWHRSVSEVMKCNVVCYEEDALLRRIYDFLCRVTIRRVVVVKDGVPTGVISRGTVLRWYHEQIQKRLAQSETTGGLDLDLDPMHALAQHSMEASLDELVGTVNGLKNRLTGETENLVWQVMSATAHIHELLDKLLIGARGHATHPTASPATTANNLLRSS